MIRHTLVEHIQSGHRSPILPRWRKALAKSWWIPVIVIFALCQIGLGGYVLAMAALIFIVIGSYDFIIARLRL